MDRRILRGILYILAASALFVTMNTGVKVLREDLPAVQLIWARTLVHLLLVVALFAPTRGGWRLFVTRRPGLQLARSFLLLASTSFFFSALGWVPLADATAVSFTAPFIVAGLAGPVLGERVSTGHWVAIAVGFLGALIIIRPGAPGANPYLLLVVGSSACYAGYQILTRRVGAFDRPETSVTYSALVGTLVLSLLVPFAWRTPAAGWQWAILSGLGLLGGVGHYCVARAFVLAPAAILSPFHYAQLVQAAVLGYLAFGDVPAAWTWLGAAVVAASGVYIAWRQTFRA